MGKFLQCYNSVAIFITKMLSEMDKTVDREGGLFGDKTQYVDTFKSIVLLLLEY